jgi:hypothetical protein
LQSWPISWTMWMQVITPKTDPARCCIVTCTRVFQGTYELQHLFVRWKFSKSTFFLPVSNNTVWGLINIPKILSLTLPNTRCFVLITLYDFFNSWSTALTSFIITSFPLLEILDCGQFVCSVFAFAKWLHLTYFHGNREILSYFCIFTHVLSIIILLCTKKNPKKITIWNPVVIVWYCSNINGFLIFYT